MSRKLVVRKVARQRDQIELMARELIDMAEYEWRNGAFEGRGAGLYKSLDAAVESLASAIRFIDQEQLCIELKRRENLAKA